MDGSIDRMETSVFSLDEATVGKWDAFVADHPEATFFHRAGWKRVIERTFGHDCHFLYAESAGNIIGVLPLVHVRSRLFANSLISTGFTVGGGPLVARAEALARLEDCALDLADRLNVDFIEYRVRAPVHDDWTVKPNLYVGFRKEIDPDPEKNLLAIPRKQRAMVRKGIKAGLESRIDSDSATVHRIYAVSVRNLGTPVFPRSLFDNLLDVFGDGVDIVTITKDGEALASVLSFYFRDQVLPYYGGGTTAARGYRMFDFGRSKTGTGAYSFKKNWGFEPEPWTYEYKLGRIGDIPDINPLNPKYRLFIAAWKRLPVAIANLVGPHIVRGLG